ncbi:MAG TPA: tripartite tricarboxylate transporter TctB family protein, partial [Desulfobacterales bacterium]|nr:tripartite tricarboxylate transporter TctB family protein [Desulfobacterales bacterium]
MNQVFSDSSDRQEEQLKQLDQPARNDAIAGILILLIVFIFASVTGNIFEDPLDPGFSARDFPMAILVLLTILSISLLRPALIALAKTGWQIYEAGEADSLFRYVVPMVAIASVYILFIHMFQYPVATFVTSIGALIIYGNRGYKRLIVIPLIATVIYYVVFFGLLGLFEEPGTVWSYSNQWYF